MRFWRMGVSLAIRMTISAKKDAAEALSNRVFLLTLVNQQPGLLNVQQELAWLMEACNVRARFFQSAPL